MLSPFSHVWLFATLWTVANRAFCLQDSPARIPKWVPVASSRGSSRPRGWTRVSWGSCTKSIYFTTEPLGTPTCSMVSVVNNTILHSWNSLRRDLKSNYTHTQMITKWGDRCVSLIVEVIYLYVSSSVIFDSTTPWTVAHQVPLSMGFSRQEHWSR